MYALSYMMIHQERTPISTGQQVLQRVLDVEALVPVVTGAEGEVTVAHGVCAELDDLRSEYDALPEQLTEVKLWSHMQYAYHRTLVGGVCRTAAHSSLLASPARSTAVGVPLHATAGVCHAAGGRPSVCLCRCLTG